MINLPISTSLGNDPLTEISQASPLKHRKFVEKFALYFKREMHYDIIQFEANETESTLGYVPYSTWLFSEEAFDHKESARRIFGACCFRWREWEDSEDCWEFDWIWFHPYFRGQGYLRQHWEFFKERFAPFHLSQPLSTPMKHFLKKQGETNSHWIV